MIGYEGDARRLLLVDDVRENRLVLRDFPQPLGFEIAEAVSSEDCLAACERQAPDAVLLELRLALILSASLNIVKKHVANLLIKMGAENRLVAALQAAEMLELKVSEMEVSPQPSA